MPVLSKNIKDLLEVISRDGSEGSFHKKLRLEAFEQYNSFPFPDKVSHLWKYSDPLLFEVGQKDISLTLDKCFSYEGESSFCSSLNLDEFLQKNLYGKLIKSDRLSLLNDALCKGVFIRVPSNVRSKTLKYKFCSSAANVYECIRVLILIEKNADVNIISELSSGEADSQNINWITEIFLEEGASLNFLNLHAQGATTISHLCQRVHLAKDSSFNNSIISLGGKITKCDLGIDLAEVSSSASVFGIVVGEGAQRFDHHTSIEHRSPNTKSELNFRVALKDTACSAYTGNLKILNEAVKSDAHQENRNLLLSDKAKAESIPELEILTNDVSRCNHGVTIGQVDKEQIYYLMSRGLDEKSAEKIIIEGFLEPTISKVPDEKLKDEVIAKISNKLENV